MIFEDIISKKLMNDNRFYSTISQSSYDSFSGHGNSSSNDEMDDESDLDDRDKSSAPLDISDTGNDDVMSMESSVNVYTDKRGDDNDDDDDNDGYDKRPMYTNYRSRANLTKPRKLGSSPEEHVKLLNNVNKTITNISNHSKDIGLTELQDLIALKTKS